LRLWSIARFDLRLSSDEFFEMTPRQLDALIKREERKERDNEFMLGQLTAVVGNFSMSRPKDPLKATDFMPSEWAKNTPPIKPKRTTAKQRKEVADTCRFYLSAMAKATR
jgi:hypothetical protein